MVRIYRIEVLYRDYSSCDRIEVGEISLAHRELLKYTGKETNKKGDIGIRIKRIIRCNNRDERKPFMVYLHFDDIMWYFVDEKIE